MSWGIQLRVALSISHPNSDGYCNHILLLVDGNSNKTASLLRYEVVSKAYRLAAMRRPTI